MTPARSRERGILVGQPLAHRAVGQRAQPVAAWRDFAPGDRRERQLPVSGSGQHLLSAVRVVDQPQAGQRQATPGSDAAAGAIGSCAAQQLFTRSQRQPR